MSEEVLMTVRGSILLSNTLKQELVITDMAVYGEVLDGFSRLKMSLPFDRIAQINILRGIFSADIELVNKGGADNLIIRAIPKKKAEEAKELIESKINVANRPVQTISVADEIQKLSALRQQGLLTDDEFQEQKRRLLI